MNKYITRHIDKHLINWKNDEDHKPLLLRGARQVGKSSAVKHLGLSFDYFLEVNFDKDERLAEIFVKTKDPKEICAKLSAIYSIPIIPGKTLLFFDEIQACIPAISSLRYFYEEYGQLHLIAAGSLLEFALKEIPSFGVGRIKSLFMYPLSFDEFIQAQDMALLLEQKQSASPENPLLSLLHDKLVEQLRDFTIVGGMPQVVKLWITKKDYRKCRELQNDIIQTYLDDFSKYKKRVDTRVVKQTFLSVARQCGSKFVYNKVDGELTTYSIKDALDLLTMAGIIIPVTAVAANGIPLGAEIHLKYRKYIFMDIGLLQQILDLELDTQILSSEVDFVNKGAIAEVLTGLELIKYGAPTQKQELYYWQRIEKNAQSEVDYVIAKNNTILPIEVKAATKGSMQSLYLFLELKHLKYGIRTSLENFSQYEKIKVIPLYAISNIKNNHATI